MNNSIKIIEENVSGVLNPELLCAMNKKYNDLLETQKDINKTEILEAISKINLQSSDFNRDYDLDDKIETHLTKEIESEHFTIELILTEVGKWNREDFEFEFLEVKSLYVEYENCKELNVDYIKEDEILDIINY